MTDLHHRPFGSGHPYRHDLDQRVPVHPFLGEEFEIRVLVEPGVDRVVVRFDDGHHVTAEPIEPASLVCDIGPFPARPAEAGHLAAASHSDGRSEAAMSWVAVASITQPCSYVVAGTCDGTEDVIGSFDVDPVAWSSAPSGAIQVHGDGDRLDVTSIEWLAGSGGPIRVRFSLRIDSGQHIIGLGERYATVDHRGEVLDAVVFEQYKNQGRRTYLPVPMAAVVGGDHWGFHVDTTRRTWFDLAATDVDHIVIEAEVDPADPALKLHVWSGEPSVIVGNFLTATGRPPLPPEWIYSPWMSANEWNTQARVETEVDRSLNEGVPVGVVVIEAWSDESTFCAFRDAQAPLHPNGEPHRLCDFTFPVDGAWPDPVGMVARLHDLGVRVVLWQIPLIPTDAGEHGQVVADADALVRLGLCVREADGTPYHNRGWWFPGALLPDFTNPETQRWWAERRRYLLDEIGIDGFKTDGGEHLWGHDLVFADGTTGAETNNRFPVLFAKTYHDLITRTGKDAVTFSRAGFTGSAAYPCHWAGDDDSTWDGLRAAIRAGLSAGIAGIWFWTWDLGGFSGPIPDAELYMRATAIAAFCPIMQYHAEYNHHRQPSNDRTPWNIAERTHDQRVLSVYRGFATLRQRLVPYLVEQAQRSLATSKPLMRPLCFDHPDDDDVWRVPLQFQLGDDLIFAPVTVEGAADVEVYLPTGEWIDAFDHTAYAGPIWLTRHTPFDEAAVYRRADGSSLLAAAFELR